MSYKTHREIIDAWPGGLPGFAADHDVKYDTAKGWRWRNSIPPQYWGDTVRLAEQHSVRNVTLEVLSSLRMAGKRSAEAAA
jgi:hypothetical protein